MKRIFVLLLSAVLALGCVTALAAEPLTADDLVLTLGDEDFELGCPAADMVKAAEKLLGRLTKSEADSCMFDGKDREWTNDAITIGSYPIGEGKSDVVESVIVTTDTLQTARGVMTGMSKQDIITLYGEGTEDWDQLTYRTEEGPMIIFTFDLDTQQLLSWMLLKDTTR